MSQVQKRRIGFLLAPLVAITACMIAFLYYSGVEAAPPNAGRSMGADAPSLGVGGLSRPPEEGEPSPQPTQPPRPMPIGPVAGLARSASAQTPPIINEWVANHTGSDTNEYVEILGDPNTDYSAYTIVEIEGDSSAPGTIDDYAGTNGAVGTTDANGIWVTAFSANALENGSMTLLLVLNFAPVNPLLGTGDDIDTNDDGSIDQTFWTSISDSIGVNDGGAGDFTYGEVELGVGFDGLSFSPGGASRIPNGTDTDSISDWRRNHFGGKGIPGFPGANVVPPEAVNTPGVPNVLSFSGTAVEARIRASCKLDLDISEPVYLFSGEFYEEVEDLRIPGRGPDFVWARKYRSLIGLDTEMGNGWECSYNISIESAGNNLIFHDGNSRCDFFPKQPDGTWQRREYFRVIEFNAGDGTYTMKHADKTLWTFAPLDGAPPAGKIIEIQDRNGNALTFDYDGLGRLATIHDTLDTAAHNRDITIAYNADGFIESVTDFIGRQIRYEYYQDGDANGSFGDLKSVTRPAVVGTPNGNDFPEGKTWVYTYSRGLGDEQLNHDLLSIRDGRGNVYLTNVYSAETDPAELLYDRVLIQIYGGGKYCYTYLPQTPSQANNSAEIKAIVNNRAGFVKELFFNSLNQMVIRRDYTGQANPIFPTTDDFNRPGPPLRDGDPDFFEIKYTLNNDSLVTNAQDSNGNVVDSTFDTGNPDPRAQGNLTQKCTTAGPLGGDQTLICEEFEYDTDFGACCGPNFITRGVDGLGNETLHEYDANGNRTKTIHRIPSIVEDFEYNQFGQMTAHVLPDNGSAHRRRDEYTYYASGPQTGYRKDRIIDAAVLALTTTNEYDSVGNVTRMIDPQGHDTQYVVNELNQVVRRISAEVTPGGVRYQRDTFYDENDNVVRVDIQNVNDAGVLQANTHFTTTFTYDVLNFMLSKTEEIDETKTILTEYEYDLNKNRSLVRYGEATNDNQPANTVRSIYDERDLLFLQIRAEGAPDQSTTQYDYDENKNLKFTRQGIEDNPRITENLYDGYDRLVGSTDPMGNVMIYGYDANHNRTPEIREGETTDVPGGAGNVRLSETAHVYDAMDRMIRREVQFFDTDTQNPIDVGPRPADGLAVTETFWTDNSQVRRVLDDNLHETLTTYDTANRVDIVTDAEDNSVTYAYDDDSLVVAITETEKSQLANPDELFTTTNAYDGLHRMTQTVDNVGNTHVYAYDSRNNRTVMTDALNHETRTIYDGINRLIKTIRDLNGDGADISAIPGDGNPDIVTAQAWDDTSRLAGQTDDSDNTTASVFDALNRMTSEVMADCTVHSYTYDVHDNRLTMTDANGSAATCTYDLLNRLTDKAIVVGPGVSNDTTAETYQYDGLSRLVLVEDDDSRVTRSHDSLSRVTTEKQNPAAPFIPADDRTITCLYDGVGNELESTYPGGRFITCAYDDLDRKQAITDATGPPAIIATYAYVGPGRVERREYGNGTRTDYTYDGITGIANPAGDFGVKRIIATTHSVIAGGATIDAREYTWDKMYNKTKREDIRPGPRLKHAYTYDDIYRLVRTVVTDENPPPITVRDTTYDLDGVGNREQVTGQPDPGPYTLVGGLCAAPADQDMNQYTTTPFDDREYDQNGNLMASFECFEGDVNADQALNDADLTPFVTFLLAGGPASCEADLNKDGNIDGLDIQPFTDRLLGLTSPTPLYSIAYDYRNQMVEYNDLSVGQRHTYAYDALGRRIARVVDADGAAGGPTETHYFYDGWQVCEEQGAAGATQATYIYGLYIDEVLNMQRAGSDFFYHTDDLYNVMAVTDTTGIVVDRYEYGDYGQPIGPTTLAPIVGDPSAVGNPYLFTGRRYDPETKWYYYRTRYLDPIAGRFTTRDTIGIWGDPTNLGNAYTYVANNPVTMTDPSGRAWLVFLWGCTAAEKTAIQNAANNAQGRLNRVRSRWLRWRLKAAYSVGGIMIRCKCCDICASASPATGILFCRDAQGRLPPAGCPSLRALFLHESVHVVGSGERTAEACENSIYPGEATPPGPGEGGGSC